MTISSLMRLDFMKICCFSPPSITGHCTIKSSSVSDSNVLECSVSLPFIVVGRGKAAYRRFADCITQQAE